MHCLIELGVLCVQTTDFWGKKIQKSNFEISLKSENKYFIQSVNALLTLSAETTPHLISAEWCVRCSQRIKSVTINAVGVVVWKFLQLLLFVADIFIPSKKIHKSVSYYNIFFLQLRKSSLKKLSSIMSLWFFCIF